MNEILTAFAAELGPALLQLVLALLSLAIAQGTMLLRRRTDSEWASYGTEMLGRLDQAVRDAVGEASLELRPDWERALADGKLSNEELKALTAKAQDIAKGYLGERGLREISRVVDAELVEKMIRAKVRAWVEGRLTQATMVGMVEVVPESTERLV